MGDVAISIRKWWRLLRFARNDRFLANVNLRHVVPKNLVSGTKNPFRLKYEMLRSAQHDIKGRTSRA